jgi:hypothetical protein
VSGPFTDADIAHYLKVVQTQRGIIEYAEAMAQVLAEVGRASSMAVGDLPETAVRRWSDVILKRALELVGDNPTPMQKKLRAAFEEQKCAPQRDTKRLTSRSTSTK